MLEIVKKKKQKQIMKNLSNSLENYVWAFVIKKNNSYMLAVL